MGKAEKEWLGEGRGVERRKREKEEGRNGKETRARLITGTTNLGELVSSSWSDCQGF